MLNTVSSNADGASLYRMVFGLLYFWLGASAAVAAEPVNGYPQKSITLVIPYGAGGDADLAAKVLAPIAIRYIPSAKIVLEHRPGNSGITATLQLKDAAPDGYTLMLGRGGNLAISPAWNVAATYTARDFTYLAILEHNPLICAVPASSPVKTARELVAALRKSNGKLLYGTAGESTVQNFSVIQLLKLIGLSTSAVQVKHFSSSSEIVQGLAKGELDFSCSNAPTMVPFAKDGKIRALFTNASGRMAAMPDLVTAGEVGLRGLSNIVGWSALLGPAGLPPAVVDTWRKALKQIATDPEWSAFNAKYGGMATINVQDAPAEFVTRQIKLYEELAVLSGLKK